MKKFDLNIEKILENWETYHAVRELIANAIDEKILTKTQDVKIYKAGEKWVIRDFGRGVKYSHLTQNENEEKIRSTKTIGKFGIGLKDALATLNRNGIDVIINSRWGRITIEESNKVGFEDIITLHAVIEDDADDTDLVGTRIILKNIDDLDIDINEIISQLTDTMYDEFNLIHMSELQDLRGRK